MPNNNIEISNYAIHKQLFAQMEPLSEEKLKKKIKILDDWFETNYSCKFNEYYMVICKEISYYTVLHLKEEIQLSGTALVDLLLDRGPIIDITYNDLADAYECWVKENEDGEVHMYYLFTYDWGVVEV